MSVANIKITATDRTQKAFDSVKRQATDVAGVVAATAASAGLAASASFLAVEAAVVGVSSEFENFKTQLETIEGSSAKAQQSMDWITEFAKTTPYEMAGVTDAFVTLKAYGIDPVDGTLRTLGDTAAAMGKPLKQGVEALADAMTGEFERLKEFGIKASVVGDQVSFAYSQNGKQMTATADKNSQQMIQATLMGIWNDKYQGGMDKMSRTWTGMTSNLGDNWTMFQKKIGDNGAFTAAKGMLGVVLDELNNNKEGVDSLASSISDGLINSMQVGIFAAGELAKGFQSLTVVDDMLRLGIDKTSGVVVDAIRAELEGVSGLLMMVEQVTGADLGSSAVEQTLASMNELRRGIAASEQESAAALGDASIAAQAASQHIEAVQNKLLLATEAARNAKDTTTKDTASSVVDGSTSTNQGEDPAVVAARANAQKVIDAANAKYAALAEAAISYSKDEETRVMDAYQKKIDAMEAEKQILLEHGQWKLEQQAQFDEAQAALADQLQSKIYAIRAAGMSKEEKLAKASAKVQFTTLAGMMGDITASASTESRAMFEVNKTASLATAGMKGWEAVQSSYAAGAAVGGPLLGGAFATIAGVATAANLKKIASMSFGSGSASASISGGGGASIPSQATNTGVPVTPTASAPTSTQQATPAPIINNYFTGNVMDTQYINDVVMPHLEMQINNSDKILIAPDSAQAKVLLDAAA